MKLIVENREVESLAARQPYTGNVRLRFNLDERKSAHGHHVDPRRGSSAARRFQGYDQQGDRSGKLSATRREDGSWAIDGSELARYLEVNGHRFRSETVPREQAATEAELHARADLAKQRLADLRSMYEDMKAQRDKWETVAQRLSLPAPKPVETPETPPETNKVSWWRWLRTTG